MWILINTTVLSYVIIYRLLRFVDYGVSESLWCSCNLIHLVVLVSKVHNIYTYHRANTGSRLASVRYAGRHTK